MPEAIQIDAPLTIRDQIEARAEHPVLGERVFLKQDQRRWTYSQFRCESVRVAHFLAGALGPPSEQRPGHVAMMLENHLELLSLLGGCAYGGHVLFGINTGLRGDVLAGVINQSRARVLVVDAKYWGEVERIASQLTHIDPKRIYVRSRGEPEVPASDWARALDAEVGAARAELAPPDVAVTPETNLMIIYTSGTTGLPKGINNNHMKLCLVGQVISASLEMTMDDVGYANMPLFHSNAMFVGLMPAFCAGAGMGLRERFSASRFLDDLRLYGSTYWNYVGEPVHYILTAIEKQFGPDPDAIAHQIADDPRIALRFALGNGCSPPDMDRFMKYFGLEDMFEFYGSTEAAISTFRRRGDPRGSVGQITDPLVKILNERGAECPPAQLDASGAVQNYGEAVGEICRVGPDTALFQGYFDNAEANAQKYRNGVYHSGDLGHIVLRGEDRFLFFDGRTADWIRKDGENFSAAQVGRIISEHPDVALAVAYGVPCPVSDELVMAAVKLKDGAQFDPIAFFAWCREQVTGGNMDAKWWPDFIRIVDEFESMTETNKVLVRQLKPDHFDRDRLPGEPLFWRRRGDTRYHEFTKEHYESFKKEFAASERLHLVERR